MAADDHKLRCLTSISDLRPGMKNVTCVFIVIDKGTTNQTKDGSIVRKCRVADRTASIVFSLWNEQADAVEEGDILRLTKGYASLWKGGMVLYSGKYGILEKIGEFTMLFSESPDMSDTNQEFAIQACHQHPNRGHANAPTPSGPGNRWAEGHTSSNGRLGPGGNRNGNNHIGHGVSSTEHAPRNETSNYQPNHFYSPHGQSQRKPLLNEPSGAYNHQRLANHPPANFHDQQHPPYHPPHSQATHMHQELEGGTDHVPSRPPMHQEREGGTDRVPSRPPVYESMQASPNDFERHATSYRERDSPWEGQSYRSRGDYPKERFHPYQRPQHSSGYHVPPNFR